MRLILSAFLVFPFFLLLFISFFCFSFSALIFLSPYCLPLRLYTVSLTLSVLLLFIFSICLYLPLLFLIFYCCVSITALSLSRSLTLLLSSFIFGADLSLCSLSLVRGQSVTVMFGGKQRASDGWVEAGALLQKQHISPLVRSIFLSSAAPGSGLHITVTEWPCRRALIKGQIMMAHQQTDTNPAIHNMRRISWSGFIPLSSTWAS